MSTSESAASHRCAACGKGGEGLKRCNACLEVRYCGVECQARHRRQHKKQCRARAAELFDEKLFAPPPPKEECPICFLPLPPKLQTLYQECCGKVLCHGCAFPPGVGKIERGDGYGIIDADKPPCPFCRSPPCYTDEVLIERYKKRAASNDAIAMYQFGLTYLLGLNGLQVDDAKGVELVRRAAELGRYDAHCKLGTFYFKGEHGLERNADKAIGHLQIAAIGGDMKARHSLGMIDQANGNVDRAMKHFMIAASLGYDESLEQIRQGYINGKVSKADYATALRAHKDSADELKSEQRDRVSQALAW
ncbi:hypothetical protein ACHAXT_008831 [Thalassiosira profunda]